MVGTYYKKRNEFSESHYNLPKQQCLFDIDKIKGEWLTFDINEGKEEATYVEYISLKYSNEENKKFDWNRIKFVALFELKFAMTERVKESMKLNCGTSGWAEFIMAQKLGMRFFYVIANNGQPPFSFFEYDMKIGTYIEIIEKLNYDKFNQTLKKESINYYWKNILKLLM